MLPRENRIKKKKDFAEVFKGGFTAVGCFFVLKYKKTGDNLTRCAFVFPVKKEKSAVRRNRVKRLFREVLRKELGVMEEGFDMVFIIKAEARDVCYEDVKKDVKKVLNKSKIIK